MRKPVQRRTVDYTSSVVRHVQVLWIAIFFRENCLLDIQSDGHLLLDAHFLAFCQKTLWFGEIRPQDTADRLQPVEEGEQR